MAWPLGSYGPWNLWPFGPDDPLDPIALWPLTLLGDNPKNHFFLLLEARLSGHNPKNNDFLPPEAHIGGAATFNKSVGEQC